MIRIRLVRHGDAMDHAPDGGGDARRPLATTGRSQATALAARLSEDDVAAINVVYASPALRCIDTATPIAIRCGTSVIVQPHLSEGIRGNAVMTMIRELTAGAVLCTHSDVIAGIVELFIERGLIGVRQARWEKASSWVLDVDGGAVMAARYEPPPDVPHG